MADERFTPETGIVVNVNVIPSGQLSTGSVNTGEIHGLREGINPSLKPIGLKHGVIILCRQLLIALELRQILYDLPDGYYGGSGTEDSGNLG